MSLEILRDKNGKFVQYTDEDDFKWHKTESINTNYCFGYMDIEKLKKEGYWYDRRDGCWKREVKPNTK